MTFDLDGPLSGLRKYAFANSADVPDFSYAEAPTFYLSALFRAPEAGLTPASLALVEVPLQVGIERSVMVGLRNHLGTWQVTGLGEDASSGYVQLAGYTAGQTVQVAVKIVMIPFGANYQLYSYAAVDPAPGEEPTWTSLGYEIRSTPFTVGEIRLTAEVSGATGHTNATIDEIRLATTYAEVVVPEPTLAALAAGAATALGSMLRRRGPSR